MITEKVRCLLGFHRWDMVYETSNSCNQIKICRGCNAKSAFRQKRHKWGDWEYLSPTSCLEIKTCSRCGEKRTASTNHMQLITEWDGSRKSFLAVCTRCGDATIDRESNNLLITLRNLDTCESSVKALSRIGTPSVEPLMMALEDGHDQIRQLVVWALGNIRDARAVEPIAEMMRQDESLYVRIACYAALEQLTDSGILESDTQELVDSIATEIRRLQSVAIDVSHWVTERVVKSRYGNIDKLRQEYGSYYSDDQLEVEEEHEVTKWVTEQRIAPDIAGIQLLIALTPVGLRDQVQALSGMSRDLFAQWLH